MWQRIKTWVHNSETIFWSRLQVALGIAAAILTYVDPSVLQPVVPSAWFPWLLVANGVFTEFLRRRRATDLK